MSDEVKPPEPVHAQPNVRAPIATQVAVLQGGPLAGRHVRVQVDHDAIEQDLGGKAGSVTYKRGIERPDGVAFDFVAPPKPIPAPIKPQVTPVATPAAVEPPTA